MKQKATAGLFNAHPQVIKTWLGQKGFTGELSDALTGYFQSKSGLTTGATIYDHINATVTKLGYTGTVTDKLNTFFCTKMTSTYPPDAERAFWNDFTKDFS